MDDQQIEKGKKLWEMPNEYGELPGDICCQRATRKYCYEHHPENYPALEVENTGMTDQQKEDREREQSVRDNQALGRGDREALLRTITRQRKWISDLQSGMYINCIYCGYRYGLESEVPASMADILKEHVEKCPEHPMSKLKAGIVGHCHSCNTRWGFTGCGNCFLKGLADE